MKPETISTVRTFNPQIPFAFYVQRFQFDLIMIKWPRYIIYYIASSQI